MLHDQSLNLITQFTKLNGPKLIFANLHSDTEARLEFDISDHHEVTSLCLFLSLHGWLGAEATFAVVNLNGLANFILVKAKLDATLHNGLRFK